MPEDHRLADPLGGEQRVDLVTRAREADDPELHDWLFYLVVLDQGVGEQPLAHLGQLRRVLDVELHEPPDVHVADPAEAERRQRALDGLTLGIQDPGLGPDQHARPHAAVRSSQASNGSPARRS